MAKPKFERTKPHSNVGDSGGGQSPESLAAPAGGVAPDQLGQIGLSNESEAPDEPASEWVAIVFEKIEVADDEPSTLLDVSTEALPAEVAMQVGTFAELDDVAGAGFDQDFDLDDALDT